MKFAKKFLLPVIALHCFSAAIALAETNGANAANAEMAAPSFEVKSDLTVTVLKTDEDQFKNLVGAQLKIGAGSDITVLEAFHDAQAGDVVHIGINNDEDAEGISDLWVPAQQLNTDALAREDDSAFGAEIEQSEHIVMEDIASRGKKKKMTYCYRFVKQYLLSHRMVPVYLQGGSAYMAANVLPKYGFKKLSIKPSQAKLNDVCVYRGGKGGNGHIEILTAKGWYYGYGYISHPIANHPFIACFRK